MFAIAGRLHAVRIEALGVRRGPPAEARALYTPLESLNARHDNAGLTTGRIKRHGKAASAAAPRH